MGEPDLKRRKEFAEFLQHVAGGDVRAIEWRRFIVTHYHDELLESIRRKTARLGINRYGGKEWSDSELASLQHWSRQLRSGEGL